MDISAANTRMQQQNRRLETSEKPLKLVVGLLLVLLLVVGKLHETIV